MGERYTPFTYQTIPSLVEAIQYQDNMGEHTAAIPYWFLDLTLKGKIFADEYNKTWYRELEQKTLIENGNWVVKFPDGTIKVYSNPSFEMEFVKPKKADTAAKPSTN